MCEEKGKAELENDKNMSMNSLITWNICKAIENNPSINLKSEMRTIQERLESESWDVNSIISQYPEARYLACALLAWQELGHEDCNSLYQFIDSNLIKTMSFHNTNREIIYVTSATDISLKPQNSVASETCSLRGPVVKLPVESKIVMRLDNVKQPAHGCHWDKNTKKLDLTKKINEACCIDSPLTGRLTELDSGICELRKRIGKLAKREGERVELLKRAEMAWQELEQGYQRRLKNAQEKEHDITSELNKVMEERIGYKKICEKRAREIEEKGNAAEKQRDILKKIETDMYETAKKKMLLSDELSRADAAVAGEQCRAAQLNRDLQFKEDQARRKLMNLESEVDSARGLKFEAERAMRVEFGALKDQIAKVSKRLLDEENGSKKVISELEDLRKNKKGLLDDLEKCKLTCDKQLFSKEEELKKKAEKIAELKEKVLECRCTFPLDATVDVKRTPSLAAICQCSANNKTSESCSCTSLRSSLLKNLLADLFGGLQAELEETGTIMPCELLKCLEDKHDWDRSSAVTTNLRDFFSRLLVGELDIAIASSIEKYHAKWVGTSCADRNRTPNKNVDKSEDCQECDMELCAQNLAVQLAEQLFQEKADQLLQKAKGMVKIEPCDCKAASATYPCLLKTPPKSKRYKYTEDRATSACVDRKLRNVTQLQVHLEDCNNKGNPNKNNFNHKETKKYTVQRPVAPGNHSTTLKHQNIRKESGFMKNFKQRAINTDNSYSKSSSLNKKQEKTCANCKNKNSNIVTKNFIGNDWSKGFKREAQSYAVNMCLCNPQKDKNRNITNIKDESDITSKNNEYVRSNHIELQKLSKDFKPSDFKSSSLKLMFQPALPDKYVEKNDCANNCPCFHKITSNSSIDKLLETLQNNALHFYDLVDYDKINNENKDCSSYNYLQNFQKRKPMTLSDEGQTFRNEYIFKSNDDVETKKTNFENFEKNIPVATISEYLGAVNLDKSNEFCKTAFGIKNNFNAVQDNVKNNSNLRFNLVNDDFCEYDSYRKLPKIPQDNQYTTNEYLKEKRDQSTNYTETCLKLCNTQTSTNLINISNQNFPLNIINNKVQTSTLPQDATCYVNFLGVTLTKNNNFVEEHNNPKHLSKSNSEYLTITSSDLTIKNNTEKTTTNKGITHISENNNNNRKREKSLELIEVNNNTVFNSSSQSNNQKLCNDQQTLSSHENNFILSQQCICCNNEIVDDLNDLEVNTFQLLTEYLKSKLQEYKLSMCHSCVLPSREQALFTDIIQKVKEIILESTIKTSCVCCGEKQNKKCDATWKRACSLLQEYLRMKLKRIQCLCDESSFYPIIFERVSNAIENDFKRLKEICSCKTCLKTQANKIQLCNGVFVPEKESRQISDRVDRYYVVGDNIDLCNISTNSINCRKQEFCQILSNLTMKCKSCEVMEKETKNTQTITNHRNSYKSDKQCIVSGDMQENKVTNVSDTVDGIKQNCVFSWDANSMYLPKYSTGFIPDGICEKTTSPVVCLTEVISKDLKFMMDGSKSKGSNFINSSEHFYNVPVNEIFEQTGFIINTAKNCESVLPETRFIQFSQNVSDKEIGTHVSSERIILKKSKSSIKKILSNTRSTSDIVINEELTIKNDKYDICDLSSRSLDIQAVDNLDKVNQQDTLYFLKNKNSKLETRKIISNLDNILLSDQKPLNCNCDMVPICHVKMLVENIQTKLLHSKCTCDFMSSKICPMHSATISL